MKLHFDHETDALYLHLRDVEIVESEEVHPGIILDFDKDNAVVAIEVLNVAARTVDGALEPAAAGLKPQR